MKTPWVIWMGPRLLTSVLLRHRREGSGRRRPCGDGRDWSEEATSRGAPGPPEGGRGRKGTSLSTPLSTLGGSTALPAP